MHVREMSSAEEEEETDEEEEQYRQSCTVGILTSLAFLAGIILLLVSIFAVKSHELWVIDRLVKFEFRDSDVVVLTTRRIFMLLLGVSAAVMIVCLVGLIASLTRHKKLASAFTTPTAILALISLFSGLQAFERKALVEPIIFDLVDDLCNFTTYVRLGRNIPCEWEDDFASEPPSDCNEFCQGRVQSLSSLDGCDILPDLCGAFSYAEVGCDEQGRSKDMYSTDATSDECATKCDDDIACTGYLHDGGSTCVLTAGVEAQHPSPEWQAETSSTLNVSSGAISWQCFEREAPVALTDFESYGTRLAWSTVVLGAVLMLTACSSTCLLYDTHVKRRGKPTARNLGMLMCCPCCASDRHQKWKTAMAEDGYD